VKVKCEIASHCTCITVLVNLEILFSRFLVSQFLLPAVSCPQTENTRFTYASDAGADSRSWASGANSGYLFAFVTQNFKFTVSCVLHSIDHWSVITAAECSIMSCAKSRMRLGVVGCYSTHCSHWLSLTDIHVQDWAGYSLIIYCRHSVNVLTDSVFSVSVTVSVTVLCFSYSYS